MIKPEYTALMCIPRFRAKVADQNNQAIFGFMNFSPGHVDENMDGDVSQV